MDVESVKAKPFGCSTSFRSLDRFHVHAEPEGADGERTPTLYLGLKNYYGAKSSPKTVGRFGLTQNICHYTGNLYNGGYADFVELENNRLFVVYCISDKDNEPWIEGVLLDI